MISDKMINLMTKWLSDMHW